MLILYRIYWMIWYTFERYGQYRKATSVVRGHRLQGKQPFYRFVCFAVQPDRQTRAIVNMHAFLKSIRAQLLIVVLVSVLPALGIILYSGFESRREAAREAEQNALSVLHGLAAENERVEEGTRQLLMTLSQLPDIQKLDSVACNRLLGKLLIQNFIYANLFVSDGEGTVVSSALPFTPHNVKHRKYFQDALNTKDFSVDEYAVGPAVDQPVLHLSYPILDARDRFKGIVVAAIDLTVFGNLYLKAKLPQGSILTASDRAGIRLFRYPDLDHYVGTADVSEQGRQNDGGTG